MAGEVRDGDVGGERRAPDRRLRHRERRRLLRGLFEEIAFRERNAARRLLAAAAAGHVVAKADAERLAELVEELEEVDVEPLELMPRVAGANRHVQLIDRRAMFRG